MWRLRMLVGRQEESDNTFEVITESKLDIVGRGGQAIKLVSWGGCLICRG